MSEVERTRVTGATAAVAAFACSPREGMEHAEDFARALLDTIGCALAGTTSDANALLEAWCARERTPGRSTVWTTGEPRSAAQAALLNGTAGHALDWDDVSPGGVLHPSTVLLPALLAQAESSGADGPALVRAHDVGAATVRALTVALPRGAHYRRGWHTTSTAGRLAAVAALANLRALDERATRNALGLVASLAGGSLANFGTMTKPLHAGVAARDAVMAVGLAADGFTANTGQLEAVGGFFALFGEPADERLASLPDDLERWSRDWPGDLAVKRYPACYCMHRAVDAALGLRAELAGRLPERIEVVVEPTGLRPLLEQEPETPGEAKFNLAYGVATALLHGELSIRHYSEAGLRDEGVRELARRVVARESERPPYGEPGYGDGYAAVTVVLPGGAVIERRVDLTYGDARNPLSDADLDAKFADCCAEAGIAAAAAERLAAIVRAVPWAPSLEPLGLALTAAVAGAHR